MDKSHSVLGWVTQLTEVRLDVLNEQIDSEFQQIPGPFGNMKIGRCRVGKAIEGIVRYPNVPCLEASRVFIHDNPRGHDFIHANHVILPNGPCRFIAAMAPKSTEISTFWSMIWQERVSAVFCLTRLSEGDSKKATIYWPGNKGRLHSAHFTIWKVKSTDETGYSVTTYEVRNAKTNEVRRITHWFYEEWPDHSGPNCTHVLIDMAEKLIKDPPTGAVIHCSAGIGRTGAFLAIIAIIKKITLGDKPNIMEIVKNIRAQRAWSVQVIQQYRLLYWAAILYTINKSNLTMDEKSALRKKLCFVRENASGSKCSVLAVPKLTSKTCELTTTTATTGTGTRNKPTPELLKFQGKLNTAKNKVPSNKSRGVGPTSPAIKQSLKPKK